MDQRLKELANLRIALATFAIQLDAFEARLKGRPSKLTIVPSINPIPIDPPFFAKQIVSAMSGGANRDL